MRSRVRGRQDVARVLEALGVPAMLETAISMEAERRGVDGEWARAVYEAALSVLSRETERILLELCDDRCDPVMDERVLTRIRALVADVYERARRDLERR